VTILILTVQDCYISLINFELHTVNLQTAVNTVNSELLYETADTSVSQQTHVDIIFSQTD